MNRLYFFLKYFGCLNYYKGVDNLSVWDWLYRYRIGFATAWSLAKHLSEIRKK